MNDRFNKQPKKAYQVSDKNMDNGTIIVFAYSNGEAKAHALKTDLFDDCDYIEMRAHRVKEFDKYAKDERIPIKDLVECGWWFSCNFCIIQNRLDEDDVENGNAFYSDEDYSDDWVKGSLICAYCKSKLGESR